MISIGITAWIMSWTIRAYLDYSVVSQIGVVYEQKSEFPAVTFCDFNKVTTQQGQNLLDNFTHNSDCYGDFVCGRNKFSDPSVSDENRKKSGLNLNVIECTYNSTDCKNDLHWYWSYNYGNCFQFNVGLNGTNNLIEKKFANVAGIVNGLYIGVGDVINLFNSDYGMAVFVHNSSLRPREEDSVYIKPGELSFIGIKRRFVQNEPSPYTQCQDLTSYSSEYYDFIKKMNRTYRQKDCFDLCTQQLIIQECGCYYLKLDNNQNKSKPCVEIYDFFCATYANHLIDAVKCASESCPLECDSIQYDLTLSSVISDLNHIINQSLKVYIYYTELEYTLIQVTPAMSLANLIANLGGTLGLIASVSFFTILEMLELFILLVYAFLKQK